MEVGGLYPSMMMSSLILPVLCVLFFLICVRAQPEYTTPGGILNTNCHKGCTEVVVHEANCRPPCDNNKYERCVLEPRTLESSCDDVPQSSTSNDTVATRPYVCRCHPCLHRNRMGMCVPVCTT